MALVSKTCMMKTYKNLYEEIISLENLYLAFKKARKRKTKKEYVKEFSKNLGKNILSLREELLNHSYQPKPLETFIIKDPKTRKISKSDFADRIVHHALCNIIEPIFDKTFIYDSYANRKGKGNLEALKRFDKFKRKVSRNGKLNGWFNKNQVKGYVLKADIKHYFHTIDTNILLKILKRKIKCNKTIWLIKKILANCRNDNIQVGMPLGNLTSQFFANVYLNELDYFVKHNPKIKYYVRYVDDFIILSSSKSQLIEWEKKINNFLLENLKIQLHPEKSKIIHLNKPITFVGFRIFYRYKLLKKSNKNKVKKRMNKLTLLCKGNKIKYNQIYESVQGSFAYMKNADTYKLRESLAKQIEENFPNELSDVEINRYLKVKICDTFINSSKT